MLEHDSFALRSLIKCMERENAVGLFVFFGAVAGLLWLVRADFSADEQVAVGFAAYLAAQSFIRSGRPDWMWCGQAFGRFSLRKPPVS